MRPEDSMQTKIVTKSDSLGVRTPLSIRPYARLLTMLGEQLLKNERVALVELIKNSYDADADHVDVEFHGFGKDLTKQPEAKLVVRDNGSGMTPEIVKTAWMNPATPAKFLAKRRGERRTPIRKRVIQGEKGIGRFAVLKLARKIQLTTRAIGAELETVVECDFTRFDDDFVEERGAEKDIFLDEVKIEWDEREPVVLPGDEHGTVIEMEVLKGMWNERLVNLFCRDVANLTDPVSRLTRKDTADRFEINVAFNGERRIVGHDEEETIKTLIDEKHVFSIQGRFLSDSLRIPFQYGWWRRGCQSLRQSREGLVDLEAAA